MSRGIEGQLGGNSGQAALVQFVEMESDAPLSPQGEKMRSASSSPKNPGDKPQGRADNPSYRISQKSFPAGDPFSGHKSVTARTICQHKKIVISQSEIKTELVPEPPSRAGKVSCVGSFAFSINLQSPSEVPDNVESLSHCEEGLRFSRCSHNGKASLHVPPFPLAECKIRDSTLQEVRSESVACCRSAPPPLSRNSVPRHPPMSVSEDAEDAPAVGSSHLRGLFRDRLPAFLPLNSSCSTATGNTEGAGVENSDGSVLGARKFVGYTPKNPYSLSRMTRSVLEFTELPLIILWIYLVYFIVIVSLTASKVKSRVWLSALVAGFLVGLGLNANAYHAIMYRGRPDIGMVIRFFLIPFGVAALSGLTHSLRDQFLLVFPRDPNALAVALTAPALAVLVIASARVAVLLKHGIPLNPRNLLLNGRIYS